MTYAFLVAMSFVAAACGQTPEADSSTRPSATQASQVRIAAAGVSTNAQDAPLVLPDASGAVGISHAPFSALLKQYVNEAGDVNYAGLKANQAKLDAYLTTLAAEVPSDSWSRNEQLAYWINAYNAFTLDLILDHYPLNSITDLDGGKPWDVKRITLAGQTYSLNQIENEIIRPRFNEPRIHFAVNCAAASCPPLRNEAFVASRLNEQLEEQTRNFINNTSYNQTGAAAASVSKIFDWYGEDFGDLKSYIGKYAKGSGAPATISFQEYDWSLNAQ